MFGSRFWPATPAPVSWRASRSCEVGDAWMASARRGDRLPGHHPRAGRRLRWQLGKNGEEECGRHAAAADRDPDRDGNTFRIADTDEQPHSNPLALANTHRVAVRYALAHAHAASADRNAQRWYAWIRRDQRGDDPRRTDEQQPRRGAIALSAGADAARPRAR